MTRVADAGEQQRDHERDGQPEHAGEAEPAEHVRGDEDPDEQRRRRTRRRRAGR